MRERKWIRISAFRSETKAPNRYQDSLGISSEDRYVTISRTPTFSTLSAYFPPTLARLSYTCLICLTRIQRLPNDESTGPGTDIRVGRWRALSAAGELREILGMI
jgi:hypothetical protein